DADVGVLILEREDQAADVDYAKRGRARDPNRPGRGAACPPRIVAGLLDEAQDLYAARVVPASLLGERDAASGPAEQRHADRLLELANVPRDARLTHPELASDRREAAALGDPNE